MNDILILSTRPKRTDLIMSGQKTLELRKRLPERGHGQKIMIYSSSPVMAVVGTCDYVQPLAFIPGQETPGRLRRARVTEAEFDAYFDDAHFAKWDDAFDFRWYAMELSSPIRFSKPVPLIDLRAIWDIEPPREWSYISRVTFDAITGAGQ